MSIHAHGWYFNAVSACYNGSATDLGLDWTTANEATAKTTKGMGAKKSPEVKGSPDQAWLTAVLGQLGSFNPNPPKGVIPISVPAGPGSHGNHPLDDGKVHPESGKSGSGGEGGDESYYTGFEDGEKVKSEKVDRVVDIKFLEMDKEEMEMFYGFDRRKFEEEQKVRRVRRRRLLVPYGGSAKYLR